VDVLAKFAAEQGIAYDLLSDEGSVVIERLGLLNPHIGAQQAFYGRPADRRHEGLPYPGTIVLDEDGTVVARHFEQSYRPRIGAGTVLRRATGAPPPRAARSTTSRHDAVTVTAFLDSEDFRPLEVHELHVELRVDEGWHLYTDPVPDGYTPLRVDVRADSEIEVWPAELPTGRPFRVQGLPEEFSVVDGTVLASVPFKLPGAGFELDGRAREEPAPPRPVTLQVDVRYQACSGIECLPPTTVRLRLRMEESENVKPTP
jgi:hypothetical protein